MYQYPMHLVGGPGLGVSGTSLEKFGPLWSSSAFSQSKINLVGNTVTGNLFVEAPKILPIEVNGSLSLHYVFNSQANNNQGQWQLSTKKKITAFPSKNNGSGTTLTLQEGDGHSTIYTYDAATGRYWGDAKNDGKPYFYHNDQANEWQWYDPATKISESYDPQGNLKSRANTQGQTTSFNFASQPITITGPSGTRYQLIRQATSSGYQEQWIQTVNTDTTVLHTYIFDNDGKLLKSRFENGYEIEFAYDTTTKRLKTITQTDGTIVAFNFIQGSDHQLRLDYAKFGSNDYIRLNYQSDKTIITDPQEITLTVEHNQNQHVSKIHEETGCDVATGYDTTEFSYTNLNQLKTVTSPNLGQKNYTYDPVYGHITQKIREDGQKTEYQYEAGGERPQLLIERKYPDASKPALVTRYVYDYDYDHKGKQHTFLRFKVSPTGVVTEFEPDGQGNIASKRIYRSAKFDLSHKSPTDTISLTEISSWVTKQPKDQILLTDYIYNSRGQCIDEYRYSSVDANGKGILDDTTYHLHQNWDEFGNCLLKEISQDQQTKSQTQHQYDPLLRLTKEINAVNSTTNNVTEYIYDDAKNQKLTIKPNKQQEVNTSNNIGAIVNKVETALIGDKTQQRTTNYQFDLDYRPVVTIRPDGQKEIKFYDRQQRLAYEVSALGIVKEHTYSRQKNYVSVTTYANSVNVASLYPDNNNALPTASSLQKALVLNPQKDRKTTKFENLSGNLRYEIDAKNGFSEYFYDGCDRKIAKISYSTPLSDAEYNTLLSGGSLQRTPDLSKDKCWQWIYDADDNVIGECDPAGYYTQHDFDVANIEWHSQLYDQKILSSNRWPAIQIFPTASSKDSHTNFYTDLQGRVLFEIDAENYLTEKKYYGNGLLKESKCYINKVNDSTWNRLTPQMPAKPADNAEDYKITNLYDLLSRLTNSAASNRVSESISYDCMGNETSHQKFDSTQPNNTEGDYCRGHQARYDGWNQLQNETNPAVNQLLLKQPNNAATIWSSQSERNLYDETGLKIRSIAPNGAVTIYYYDLDRRPVVIINDKGGVLQLTLNSFSEQSTNRRYYNPLTQDQLSTLQGGFVNNALLTLLSTLQNDKDAQETFDNNQNGKLTYHRDAEGYESTKEYDVFNRCEKEIDPIDSTHNKTTTHEYDLRDLELETKCSDGTISQIKTYEYESALGENTKIIDENQGVTTKLLDTLGRAYEIQQTTEDNAIDTQKITYDALNRISSETDSNNHTTTHEYQQQTGVHKIIPPIANTQTTITSNIFNEIVKNENALNASDSYKHDSFGKVTLHTDPLGRTTQDEFDIMGNREFNQNVKGTKTEYSNDTLGFLTKEIDDTDNLKLTTEMQRDQWGNSLQVTDANNVVTQNTFDKRDCLTQALRDPDGLGLVTLKSYNAQKVLTNEVRGDLTNNNQYEVAYTTDSFGRANGQIIDPTTDATPNGLALTEIKKFDNKSQLTKEIDANKKPTYTFWDSRGKKRFTVDGAGQVKEWRYDLPGLKIADIEYYNKVDPKELNDDATLQTIKALVKPSPYDGILRTFYDANNRPQFTITAKGSIVEKTFNNASKRITEREYATAYPVESYALINETTEKIQSWVNTHKTSKDRITQFVLDGAGNERFILDGANYLIEQQFDEFNNCIMKIKYASPQPQLADKTNLSPTEFSKLKTPKPGSDMVEHWIYNSVNYLSYTVNGDGLVTHYTQDGLDNETEVYKYATSISPIYDTNQVKTTIDSLEKLSKDRKQSKDYDKGNRLKARMNEVSKVETFESDAVGNARKHIDYLGNVTTVEVDRANRNINETSASLDITTVTQDNGVLNTSTVTTAIVRHTDYDKDGNPTTITDASNLPASSRSMTTNFDASNQITGTEIPNSTVDINDVNIPASYAARPEKTITLQTGKVYDGKGNVVVEENEIGSYRFHVYDADDNERFTVEHDGAVVESQFNTFGNAEKIIKYAKRITIDVNACKNTGLTEEFVENALKDMKGDPNNRTTINEYNIRGDLIRVLKDPVLFYVKTAKGIVYCDFMNPEKVQVFNAFHQCILQKDLIYAEDVNNPATKHWSQQRKWYNFAGEVIARSNPRNFVKQKQYNAFNEEIWRREYKNSLPITPDENTDYATLKSMLFTIEDPNDKEYEKTYNNLGLVEEDIQLHITVNKVENGKLTTAIVDKKTTYTYDDNGNKISEKEPGGLVKYYFYNSRNDLIAETGFPVMAKNFDGVVTTLTPLIYYGIDAFRQQVTTKKFKYGAAQFDPNSGKPPQPLHPCDEDIFEIKYLDNRNQVLYHKDAKGNVEGYTYLATPNKGVRHWYRVTNLNETGPGQNVTHIDEEYTNYNAREQITKEFVRRDGVIDDKFTLERIWNAFGEKTKEGPGDGSYPAIWEYDNTGWCWRSNGPADSNGTDNNQSYGTDAWKASLCDGRNFPTVTMTSTTKNLDEVAYQDWPDFIKNSSIHDLEKNESVLDDVGGLIQLRPAPYEASDLDAINVIPLNMTITTSAEDSTKTNVLSWTLQHVLNVKPTFMIKLAGTNNPAQSPDITMENGRCYVDLSSFVTDIYDYDITYSMPDPFDEEAPAEILYRTTGQIQVDNCLNSNSQHVVTKIVDQNQLVVTGRTANLHSLQLCRNGIAIMNLPVSTPAQNQELVFDLDLVESGEYTVLPIYADNQVSVPSLPFLVTGTTMGSTLFAEEIPCSCNLQTLDKYGQLTWQVPSLRSAENVMLQVIYLDEQGNSQIHQDTITPTTNKGGYQDSNGNTLTCNTVFPTAVSQVQSLSLMLQVNATEWIPLQVDYQPLPTTNSKKIISDNNNQTENKSEKYSAKNRKPRLQFFRPGEKIPEFYQEVADVSELDRAPATFGLTRDEFVDKLITYSTNKSLCDLLQTEIREAVKHKTFNLKFEKARLTLNRLSEEYNIKSDKDYDATITSLLDIGKAKEASVLVDALNQYHMWEDNKYWDNQALQADKLVITPEIYSAYVSRVREGFPITKGIATLFAKAENYHLTLWKRSDKTPGNIEIDESIATSKAKRHCHLLNSDGKGRWLSLKSVGFKPQSNSNSTPKLDSDWVDINDDSSDLEDDWFDAADKTKTKLVTVKDPQTINGEVSTYNFSSAQIAYVKPTANLTTLPDVKLFNTDDDYSAQWINILPTSITTEGFTLDVTGMAAGAYPIQVTSPEIPKPLSQQQIYITNGAWVYPSNESNATQPQTVTPVYNFTTDAWGYRTSKTTPLGYKETTEYNPCSQEVVRTSPETTVYDESGQSSQVKPTVQMGYDIRDHHIATIDKNGLPEVYECDVANKVLSVTNAVNEIIETCDNDIFGNIVTLTDRTKQKWTRTYDLNDNLIKQTTPSNTNIAYTFNEINLPNSKTDEGGNVRTFGFDIKKNINYRTEPNNERVDLVIDRNCKTLSEIFKHWNNDHYEVDAQRSWKRHSLFDYALEYTDFGGAFYDYKDCYDLKKQLTKEKSTPGAHGMQVYETKSFMMTEVAEGIKAITTFFTAQTTDVKGRDLDYTYKSGLLTEVRDNVSGQVAKFGYDADKRRIRFKLFDINGALIRDGSCEYDGSDQVTVLYDTQMVLATGYDGNGNRRFMRSKVYTDNYSEPMRQEQWYTYSKDGSDFVLIDGGVLSNGVITLEPNRGRQYEYTDGLRTVEKWLNDQNQLVSTTLDYNERSWLTGTTTSDGQWTKRGYNVLGLMTNYQDPNTQIVNVYNVNGWLSSNDQTQDGTKTTTTYDQYDGFGNSHHQVTTFDSGHDDLINNYNGTDTLNLATLGGYRYNKYGRGEYSCIGLCYTSNAGLSGVVGAHSSLNELDATNQVLIFTADYTGLSVTSRKLPGYLNEPCSLTEWRRFFYSLDGHYVGSYMMQGEENNLNNSQNKWYLSHNYLNPQTTTSGGQEVGYDSNQGGHTTSRERTENYNYRAKNNQKGPIKTFADKKYESMTLADTTPPVSGWQALTFDHDFKERHGKHKHQYYVDTNSSLPYNVKIEGKDNTSYPATGPTTCIATSSDTDYSSIAQKQFGDSRNGESIQLLNGLDPYAGMPVSVPPMIRSHNDSKAFIPVQEQMQYMLSNVMIYPLLKSKYPKPKFNWWSVVFIAVGVIVAICTGGAGSALGGILAQILGETLGYAISAGLVAAGVTLALEVLGSVTGVSSFSWRDVAAAGIDAAAMDLFGVYDPTKEIDEAVLDACMADTTAQLIRIETGVSEEFNWRELIAIATSVGIAKEVGNHSTGSKTADRSLVSTLETAERGILYTGHLDPRTIMAQSVGTALGSTVGDSLTNAFTPTPEQKAAKEMDKKKLNQAENISLSRKQMQQKLVQEKRFNQLKADYNQRADNAMDGHSTRNDLANRNRNQLTNDNKASARSKSKEWWNDAVSTSSDVNNRTPSTQKRTPSFWDKVVDTVSESMQLNQAFEEGKYTARTGMVLVDVNKLTPQQQERYYEGFGAKLGDDAAILEVGLLGGMAGGLVKQASSLALKKFGLFKTSDASDNLLTQGFYSGSENHINGLRLQRKLGIEQAGVHFEENGRLTQQAIENSKLILRGKDLENHALKNILGSKGNIEDWGKYETRSTLSPSGKYKTHFYYNRITNEAYYDLDYKSKFNHHGAWNIEVSPNFEYKNMNFKSLQY